MLASTGLHKLPGYPGRQAGQAPSSELEWMSAAAVANEEGMEAATPTRERRGEETSDVEEGTERVRWSTATEESSCSNEKAGTDGRTK